MEAPVLLVRSLRNLVSGLLLLFLVMTVVAIVLKVTGSMPWTTLGIWLLLDVAALVVRRILIGVQRRIAPRPAPKVS